MTIVKLDCNLCKFKLQCELNDMKSYRTELDNPKDYQECYDQLYDNITDISNVFIIGDNNGK